MRSARLSSPGHDEDFADLYDNAPCGYLSLSPDSIIVLANRTIADWLGCSVEDLIHLSVRDILSFGGKIALETHLSPILKLSGSVHEVALDLLDSAGEKVPVLVNAVEKRDSNRRLLTTRLTVFKTVDRRMFERSLIEAKAKAEERARIEHKALEFRDQFIAVLGHDLRNPIAAVSAGIGLLKRDVGLTERQNMIISEMDKSLQRSNRLIDDVLDLARGKLGGTFAVDIQHGQTLQPILDLIVGEIRAVAGEREIVSNVAVEHAVDCDPDRIGQLASNLLANAVRHGSKDHPITFTASTTPDDFQLSITNGGEAITGSALKNLFKPFARGRAANAKQSLGLGLFIVNEISKAHAGQMQVISTNEETQFSFAMPRKALPSAEGPQSAEE